MLVHARFKNRQNCHVASNVTMAMSLVSVRLLGKDPNRFQNYNFYSRSESFGLSRRRKETVATRVIANSDHAARWHQPRSGFWHPTTVALATRTYGSHSHLLSSWISSCCTSTCWCPVGKVYGDRRSGCRQGRPGPRCARRAGRMWPLWTRRHPRL